MHADAIFFWIFAATLVFSALAVIMARNPVHSVLFLILAFVSAAGLFLLMGADIDDDKDHAEEFGARQHEQAGGADEGEDQEQHGMHGVARHDHRQRGEHQRRGENPEKDRIGVH